MAPRAQARVPTVEARPVQRIVVAAAGEAGEEPLHDYAARFAAALAVPLLALHVHPPSRPAADFGELERLCGRLGVTFMAEPVPGTDAGAEIVAGLDASDLCLVGSRRRGADYGVGRVAQAVLRGAPGPVQLVRLG